MQLTGKQSVNAVPAKVWQALMDADTLGRIIPGISRLERIDGNTFKSEVSIKLGPVSGSFTGNLQMEDLLQEKGFALKVQQNSKLGNVNAVIKIEIEPVGEHQTQVAFDGDVKLSGMLASMGQRVLGGVANTLSKQFFTNLEKELAEPQSVGMGG